MLYTQVLFKHYVRDAGICARSNRQPIKYNAHILYNH